MPSRVNIGRVRPLSDMAKGYLEIGAVLCAQIIFLRTSMSTPAGPVAAKSGSPARRRGAPPEAGEPGSWQSIISTVQKIVLAFVVTQLCTSPPRIRFPLRF